VVLTVAGDLLHETSVGGETSALNALPENPAESAAHSMIIFQKFLLIIRIPAFPFILVAFSIVVLLDIAKGPHSLDNTA
jgi:hypothetical protein